MLNLSIIICTYNRSNFLETCLESLVVQNLEGCEVIVVDNNSSDNTRDIIYKYANSSLYVRGVKELKQGLSHARNRGMMESLGGWIAYLDDDAYTSPSYVTELKKEIQMNRFDAFGGLYLPWYKFGKKSWYKDNYGSNELKKTNEGFLDEGYFIDGGNSVFKKELLLSLNGFNSELGMSGNKVSYGEETELQIRARLKGYKLGFNPQVLIYHLVPWNKQKVSWFLKSAFKNGEMYWDTYNFRPSFLSLIKTIIRLGLELIKTFLGILAYPIKRRDKEIQNIMIESFSPIANISGKLISGIKLLWRRN